METEFTKGPWKILNDRVGVIDKSGSQSFGMMQEVAYVDMYNFGKQEGKANAHLIASSPEMYEFIERLSDLDECQMLKTEIKHLLAKARGEANE